MKKRKITEDVAQQIEQEASEDADLWTQEPTKIEARPARTSVLSLRLPTKEFHALLRAARAAGESVSEYVRTAIAMRQAHEPMTATVNVSYTVFTTQDTPPPIMRDEFSEYIRGYTAGNPQPEPTVETSTKCLSE
jgi:anthranilate phosphoribosyltransferase